MARILGMKESVCSWICVTACTIDTIRPTTRPTSSSGSASLSAMPIAAVERLMTTSWSMAGSLSVEALDKRARDEVPPVHQDEQEDLEGQGDEDGRQHHHAHRHQGGA